MYSKWIKSGFVLAMLLISTISLSMAVCPWSIKNELYAAQCGVEKVVPASEGLLANDPTATAVLNPDSVTVDAKYGTLDVNADGSFVFDPSPDIVTGTYVQFNYNATNGVCQARYPGLAKILVSCKCRPQVANVILCLPTTLDEIRQKLEAAGVGCFGCGTTVAVDLSKVKLEPGTYSFSITCPGCQAASGSVTLVSGCEANAPSFTFCEGTVTLAQLQGMINAQADCTGTGCDQAPVINTAGVTLANGFVSGGSYTATCAASTDCADTATGTITVVPKCVVDLISVTLECGTPAQIEAQIKAENPSPCGDCDTTPTFQFPVWPLRADGSGNVANGVYRYTVTCNAGGLAGCDSSAIGEVVIDCQLSCPCVATAKDVTVCAGLVTLEELEENYLRGNVSCRSTIGTFCDVTAEIDTENVTVDTNGFVTGGTYKAVCQPTEDCLAVEATGKVTTKPCIICTSCEASAPCFRFCEGTVTLAQLTYKIKAQAKCTGSGCSAPTIDLSDVDEEEGFVSGGTYTATCGAGTACEDTATGTITVVPKCVVDLTSVSLGCGTPAQIEAQIKAENPSPCGDCDTTPTFKFPVWPLRADGSGKVANGEYQYTVTCNAGGLAGCDSSAIGEVIVDCQLPCPCIATAKCVTVCAGAVTIDQLEDIYLPGNVSCKSTIGTLCDVTAEIDTNGVTVDKNGFVTGGTYKAICQPDDDCSAVEATGKVTTKPCNICTCEANAPDICVPRSCKWVKDCGEWKLRCHKYTLDEIKAEIAANGGGCSTGCTMTLKFYKYGSETSFSNLKWDEVKHYTYKVICTKGTCVDTDTGKLDVLEQRDCSCQTCDCD